MKNMYSRNFIGPRYDRLMNKQQEDKYYLDSAVNGGRSHAQNISFLVPYEKVTFRTTAGVNSLYSIRLL